VVSSLELFFDKAVTGNRRRVDVRDGPLAPTSLVSGTGTVPAERRGAMSGQTASPGAPTTQTTRLLACGIVAGPLFLAAWLIQAFTREGFDPTRHPPSLLSLGELGWIQIANFVVTGLLYVACAVGMWRVLHPGRSGTWGPLLVGGFGIGLILAGIFTTDPGAGFPRGAPAGAPEQLSWHGVLHGVGFVVAFVSWTAVGFVLVRRFVALRRRGWVAACVATPLAVLVLASWPDPDSLSLRLVLATAIQFGFLAAVATRLMGGLPDAADAPPAAWRARRLQRAA
jgi:Protein of unknown function (DUF998)